MRITAASIVGVILESLLYGMFIPLLLTSGCVQWQRRPKGRPVNVVMVFTTAFYGLTITSHWMVNFVYAIRGVFFLPPGKNMEIQILVADLIMIYRLYHIYRKNISVCIVPSIGSLAHFALIFGIMTQAIRTRGPAVSTAWVAGCFSVTAFNSLCTPLLIGIRLWRTHNLLSESNIRISQSPITRAMYVLVESAALWTTFVVINFILFMARANLRFATLDMTGPMIGISFCLIIVRLGHPENRASLPSIKTADFVIPTFSSTSSSTADREDPDQGHERDVVGQTDSRRIS